MADGAIAATAPKPAQQAAQRRTDGAAATTGSYIFTLLGTGGDIWPGVMIAAELQRRGHAVVVLSYDYFADEIARAGVPFVAIGSAAEYLAQVTTARFWERHGTSKGLDENGYLRLALRPVYDYIVSRLAEVPLLVCTRNAYGARFAAEKFGLPVLCLAFSSTQFASAERFPYSAPSLARLPLWMRRISMALGDQLYNQPLLKKLNPLRKSVHLPTVRRMRPWSFFGTPSLALYPSWYNDVTDLAHYGVRQANFVFARSDEGAPLPDELTNFLQAGEPPVAFTFGTGVAHVREVFEKAVAALSALGMRGLFITKFGQNLPADVGQSLVVPYADFAALLPRVALLVHHGGVGTAAQAIRAGVPQLIIPLAFDQPDNAHRFKTLGLAEFLPSQKFPVAALVEAIRRALSNVSRDRLMELRQVLLRNDGSALAADHCEAFFNLQAGPRRVAAR